MRPVKPPPPVEPDSRFPVVEAFVETGDASEVAALFDPLRAALDDLKGPRAVNGKKVRVAIERTEELLHHLLEVRKRLEQEAGPVR